MLFRTVGIEEFTGNIYNSDTVPCHGQSRICLDGSNHSCLKVLGCRKSEEAIHVLCLHNDSHSFLRLGNSKLGAVKSLVFFGNCVEVDVQSVGKLTDGNRNTACAKVVTTLDQATRLSIAEQALKLTLLGRISLCTSAPQVSRDSMV